jgi:hypothetical protein
MSLVVGALFGVVVNLHTSDAALGDTAEVTLWRSSTSSAPA